MGCLPPFSTGAGFRNHPQYDGVVRQLQKSASGRYDCLVRDNSHMNIMIIYRYVHTYIYDYILYIYNMYVCMYVIQWNGMVCYVMLCYVHALYIYTWRTMKKWCRSERGSSEASEASRSGAAIAASSLYGRATWHGRGILGWFSWGFEGIWPSTSWDWDFILDILGKKTINRKG